MYSLSRARNSSRSSRRLSAFSRQILAASSRKHSTETRPIKSLLIANRGEIALRVGRTASEYGIKTTTIYTKPDAHAQHALSSAFAVNLGDVSAYLDGDRIISVAKQQNCQAIHPGYGFLSENAVFAKKCTEAGITFVGPPWQAIEAMGSKSRSKEIMTAAGVPCIPGYHGVEQNPEHLATEAAKIGYPVLLKAVKGGGGKGMRIVKTPADFADQLSSAKSEARNSFGDDVMLVEKYITKPRHIEVQVFADKHGNCVALGERDCSIQRRHQKILEESPAPDLDDAIRKDLWAKARAAALAVNYEGAGTVEFIFDNDTNVFFFMEMNTRLQVEHPVTEMVTGQDLVHWQLIVAAGGTLPLTQEQIEQEISHRGHAVEARIYAENPDNNFSPDSGKLLHLKLPQTSDSVRIDAGFVAGDEVSSHYDPMIAKLIVRAPTRQAALQKMRAVLEEYEVGGPVTNIEFLKRVVVSPAFCAGKLDTGYIDKYREELFARQEPPVEAYAQAAIALLLQEQQAVPKPVGYLPFSALGGDFQQRSYALAKLSADGLSNAVQREVKIQELGPNEVAVTVDTTTFTVTTSSLQGSCFTSWYPHTRLETTAIRDGHQLTLWQRGQQHRFQLVAPPWIAKALGTKDVAHSVLAPMPCKVLRVEVQAGQTVKKDQIIAVIESMKMETIIRSPKDAVIARVVHGPVDMCKAGTALVEFEETS